MASILILGGGTGGVVAANVLGKILDREHRITLIDRRDSHIFYGSFPLLMVNRRKPEDLKKRLSTLRKKGVEFVQTEIRGIFSQESVVRTDTGPFKYDYLIISLGAEHHPETVPGFSEGAFNAYSLEGLDDLRNRLEEFHEGRIVFFISSLPFICPPAPYEMMFLLDDYFRQRGIRKKVELTMVTPEPSPEPLAGPKVGLSVRKMMDERDIDLNTEAKVLSLDYGAGKLNLDQGVSFEGELFIGVPPHWGPSIMRDTGLIEGGGWIEVSPRTLQTRVKNIYAIGDATALRLPVKKVLAPKAGIFAHYQAEVVARNIASLIAGRKPRHRYKARGM